MADEIYLSKVTDYDGDHYIAPSQEFPATHVAIPKETWEELLDVQMRWEARIAATLRRYDYGAPPEGDISISEDRGDPMSGEAE